MKTLKYIVLVILLSINFVSCDPPTINEEVGVEVVENSFTSGNDNELEEGEEN